MVASLSLAELRRKIHILYLVVAVGIKLKL